LDPLFIQAQNNITDRSYKAPARSRLKEFELKSPLSFLVFYDTMVQHGDDFKTESEPEDPDGFSGILKKMKSKSKSEKEFLLNFLESRRAVLMNAYNPETREEWRKSVNRVDALEGMINNNFWSLEGNVIVHIWNTDFPLP
jgi:hypothetical protein